MLVLDATPLIYLAKVGKATLLAELDEDLVVPRAVHREVVEQGRRRSHPDASRIAKLVDEGVLQVGEAPATTLAEALVADSRLHEAERAVLVLAHHHGARAILDEKHGRRIAEVEGVAPGGTILLLIRLVKADALTPREMRDTVDALLDAGWYCSTDLYARILRTIERLEDRSPEQG